MGFLQRPNDVTAVIKLCKSTSEELAIETVACQICRMSSNDRVADKETVLRRTERLVSLVC